MNESRILNLVFIRYLVLENLIPPSLNVWYSGQHWSKKALVKKMWEIVIFDEVRKKKLLLLPSPVTLAVTLEFGANKRTYDSSNSVLALKFTEDGLVKAGMLKNDSRFYIIQSVLKCVRSQDGKDRTVIEYSEE